jgi:hypothetical protein
MTLNLLAPSLFLVCMHPLYHSHSSAKGTLHSPHLTVLNFGPHCPGTSLNCKGQQQQTAPGATSNLPTTSSPVDVLASFLYSCSQDCIRLMLDDAQLILTVWAEQAVITVSDCHY